MAGRHFGCDSFPEKSCGRSRLPGASGAARWMEPYQTAGFCSRTAAVPRPAFIDRLRERRLPCASMIDQKKNPGADGTDDILGPSLGKILLRAEDAHHQAGRPGPADRDQRRDPAPHRSRTRRTPSLRQIDLRSPEPLLRRSRDRGSLRPVERLPGRYRKEPDSPPPDSATVSPRSSTPTRRASARSSRRISNLKASSTSR